MKIILFLIVATAANLILWCVDNMKYTRNIANKISHDFKLKDETTTID